MPAGKDKEGKGKKESDSSNEKEGTKKDGKPERKVRNRQKGGLSDPGPEKKKVAFKKKEKEGTREEEPTMENLSKGEPPELKAVPPSFIQLHLYTILSLVIITPVLVLIVGYLLFPEVIWDKFLWKYYWGPIVADAEDRTIGGISEVYNPVDTLTYAIILMASVIAIYRILEKFKVKIDGWFTLSIVPFILFGSFVRVLEDAGSFEPPIIYLFISPIIYIWVGLMTLGLLLLSVHTSRVLKRGNETLGFTMIGIGFAIMVSIVLAGHFIWGDDIDYSLPVAFPPLFGALIYCGLYFLHKRSSMLTTSTLLLGFGLFPMCLALIALLMVYSELEVFGALAIIGLSIGLTVVIWDIARSLQDKYQSLAVFLPGINLLLIFGHLLDGAATFIGIDYFGYHEKHVLPTFLIDTMGTAFVMVPLKIVIICAIIYVLDDLFKEDLKNDRTLVGLIKITILVLGLAPGTRDLVRLGLGV